MVLCLCFAFAVPETRSEKSRTFGLYSQEEDTTPAVVEDLLNVEPGVSFFVRTTMQIRRRILDASRFFWKSHGVALLLLVFLLNAMGSGSSQLLVIYATMKFNWKISEVSKIWTSLYCFKISFLIISKYTTGQSSSSLQRNHQPSSATTYSPISFQGTLQGL
jgi:hypothetical protein